MNPWDTLGIKWMWSRSIAGSPTLRPATLVRSCDLSVWGPRTLHMTAAEFSKCPFHVYNTFTGLYLSDPWDIVRYSGVWKQGGPWWFGQPISGPWAQHRLSECCGFVCHEGTVAFFCTHRFIMTVRKVENPISVPRSLLIGQNCIPSRY
jgi:hypothetical protein